MEKPFACLGKERNLPLHRISHVQSLQFSHADIRSVPYHYTKAARKLQAIFWDYPVEFSVEFLLNFMYL